MKHYKVSMNKFNSERHILDDVHHAVTFLFQNSGAEKGTEPEFRVKIVGETEKQVLFSLYTETQLSSTRVQNVVIEVEEDPSWEPVVPEEGKAVRLFGVVAYSQHLTTPRNFGSRSGTTKHVVWKDRRGNTCVDSDILVPYLEKRTGLCDVELVTVKKIDTLNLSKMRVANAFKVEIQGKVRDKSATEKLNVSSVGKKRSYGFGGLFFV